MPSVLIVTLAVLVVAIGSALRLWGLSGNYPILPDTALQIDGARASLEGNLPYTYLDLPGPGIAMLPLLAPAGYTFGAAQLGIALYGCLLIVLCYALARLLFPDLTWTPLIFAALVAINPALVASSRIGFMESIQISAIVLFLVTAAAYVRFESRLWLWASFALAAALLVLKEPNAIVVAIVYGALGIRELYAAVRARSLTVDLGHLVAGALLVLLPVTLAIILAWQEDKLGRASGGFGLSYLSRNAEAAWDFFRSPLDAPATGYYIYHHAVALEPSGLFAIAVAWGFLAAGAVFAVTRRDFVPLVWIAALLLYGAFYLFFSEWFSRFSLTFLLVQLLLIAVGVEVAARALARRSVILAAVVPAIVLPAIIVSFGHTVQMINDWDGESSYVDNGILVRPADLDQLEQELFQRPTAFVITTQPALVRMLDEHRRDDVLDLWKFGVQRRNSLQARTELEAIINERIAAGQDVLYVPGILDIEDGRGQQPRGWGFYYDLVVTDLEAELVHASRNFVSQKFNRARPTFMIYVIPSPSPRTALP